MGGIDLIKILFDSIFFKQSKIKSQNFPRNKTSKHRENIQDQNIEALNVSSSNSNPILKLIPLLLSWLQT